MTERGCQIYRLVHVEGEILPLPMPLRRWVKVTVLRCLRPPVRGQLNALYRRLKKWFSGRGGARKETAARTSSSARPSLEAGDLVRVRSKEEIRSTLDRRGRLKGCRFMAEMWQYCDTTQRVLKPLRRFFDECDYRVKTSTGLVLLEGLMCQGTVKFNCDRSCFYFWRAEWLEKLVGVETGAEASS